MNGITAYQEYAVTTQSKSHLIIMLYGSAIELVRLAIKELEERIITQMSINFH